MPLEERPAGMGKGAKRTLVILGLLVVIAAIAAIVMSFMTEGKSRKRTVIQQIAVLRPPPPPPPKPEEKPPEPEIEKQEVKLPEPDTPPEPQQADAPASPDLGVDAQGTGNGDSFGLVGKPGGKDITTIGAGGGGDRAQFSFFAGSMQRHFAEQFNKNEKLKNRDYKVVIKVWLGTDGRVQKFEIAGSSGNEGTDSAIKSALSQMTPMAEPPPENMPQPVRLRMTSRGAG